MKTREAAETSRVMRRLARKRWKNTTAKQRSDHGRALVALRWAKRQGPVSAKESPADEFLLDKDTCGT
jgi:hypothetical protein